MTTFETIDITLCMQLKMIDQIANRISFVILLLGLNWFLLHSIQNRKYLICCGTDGFAMNTLTCGAAPPSSLGELLIQVNPVESIKERC